MTLTATVIKKGVTNRMPKMWSITLNMTLSDGTIDVLNHDYSIRYRVGDSIRYRVGDSIRYRVGDSITSKQAMFIAMMQVDIDKYKSEQVIFNAPALDTVVANVQTSLET